MTKKISRLFIANRGEICRRIAMTAKALGIETVAPVSPGKKHLFLESWIDQFCELTTDGPAAFLDAQSMIDLAIKSACDGIHPGFGFLSENAEFAQLCVQAGLIWVGPSPDSIRIMASKKKAREVAVEAGLPCMPALVDFDSSTDQGRKSMVEFAQSAGFPVLIKAALGGGGKGMRVVHDKDELIGQAERSRSEAASSFGDDTLILEKFLTAPRHVEVQILSDKHGQNFAIGDRDCSVQRRHQKIIEEAPAPHLPDQTRAKMHQAAIKLAAAANYDSTGTVEFLVDQSALDRGDVDCFYFLEMNTRLQVEHPVSEEVYGLDLVAMQLAVANNEKLPPELETLQASRHSVEARIYAEDCANQFLPSPDAIWTFLPSEGVGIRWEIGIDEVDQVSPLFDPMVAKIVATGRTRDEALDRLTASLSRTVLLGATNNILFLNQIANDSSFRKGGVTTGFIEEKSSALVRAFESSSQDKEAQATQLLNQIEARSLAVPDPSGLSPTRNLANFTASIFSKQSSVVSKKSDSDATVTEHLPGYFHSGSDRSRFERGRGLTNGNQFHYVDAVLDSKNRRILLWLEGHQFKREIERKSVAAILQDGRSESTVVAPVPGKVITVRSHVGDKVEKGETILVLESMKMEFEVKSDRESMVEQIHVSIGDQVNSGDKLVSWQEEQK